ncbi:MAG: aldehyde dehydrogenase family protein [Pigmentiphaga sp.]|uniref:aldehyde dehydrogenase family protein n=1 Tax=Pigmentiphaga sp. TaxID=1977564 RepID=UPI0029A4C2D2|nr:aldehyde dehydrogenase family protein [Pigmentiphaga sp.]MDX3907187.1 aldehyde dehydrogenase family protein [Pigmentiphaga sp.]
MNAIATSTHPDPVTRAMPTHLALYYGGAWHAPAGGFAATFNPATGQALAQAPQADAADVDAAVRAAQQGFRTWSQVPAARRGALLREIANRLRTHADELALLDSANCGNPFKRMQPDAHNAAAQIDYYAGLVHELKGETIPTADGGLNYSVREPLGVVARIVAYNHPLMFLAGKLAPVLAAGNSVIMKAPDQAPLSALRFAEIVDGVLPPGVLNIVTGGRECGEALVRHPLVKKVALIGSVPTGAAILRAAADKIMPVTLELGGKNPLVVCPDADPDGAVLGAINGMNFTWAGQSCGSTSRLFVHESLYDRILDGICSKLPDLHRCGLPTDPATTMGCLISQAQFDKVMGYIELARSEGARLAYGGGRPADPALAAGWFIEPTVFADVTPGMRIFREEVFGPVLSVIKWHDEDRLVADVNSVEYGLSASIYTRDLARAHRLARRIEAGYVWINTSSAHYTGANFGGYKKSGLGREEGLEELLAYTQVKNVHVAL